MLSIKECRKFLGNDYSDNEIEKIRNTLYKFALIYFDFDIRKKIDEINNLLSGLNKRTS